jgi:ethanolamine utilization protein EutQ (cupin superfamily)
MKEEDMSQYRIDLSEVTWSDSAPGLKTVTVATGLGTLRLAVFAAGFKDADWCSSGHLGYCLEGEAEVAFESGETVVFRPGDVVSIPAGTKHKTTVGRSESRIVFFSAAGGGDGVS